MKFTNKQISHLDICQNFRTFLLGNVICDADHDVWVAAVGVDLDLGPLQGGDQAHPEQDGDGFHLVDSIAKKISVVKAIAKDVGLDNLSAEQSRIEDLSLQQDYVVSRAVARMISFYRWVEGQLKPGGTIYYLKGGDITEEMLEVKRPFKEYDLTEYFEEDFFETKKVVHLPLKYKP